MSRDYIEIKLDKKDIENLIERKVQEVLENNLTMNHLEYKLRVFRQTLRKDVKKLVKEELKKK